MQQKTHRITKNSQPKSSPKGEIRIIGGKWRGRKLPVLNAIGLRPTTDRVKETLFNWLSPYLHDSEALDCYSGSGSLGFEVMSRGAKQATLLEKDRVAATQLTANKLKLDSPTVTVINTDTLQWLNKPATATFDVIFIDPPFGHQLVEQTITLLEKNGWLKSPALIYVETEISHHEPKTPENWQPYRQKQAGQVCYRLYRREQTKTEE